MRPAEKRLSCRPKMPAETRDLTDDPLFVFELDVARRADELSRLPNRQTSDPLELWTQAEREVLAAGSEGAKRILAGGCPIQR
jgi:hypothetical protein